jgi:amino-acid N-acetyltransferase
MSQSHAVALRVRRRPATPSIKRPTPVVVSPCPALTVRSATAADAPALHALIQDHLCEGHLLPRDLHEIAAHAHRFVLVTMGDAIVGCADLAPLGRQVAEVRSLVVTAAARSRGVGRRLLDELTLRATAVGYDRLCAFTHAPAYFVKMGFSLVPHAWLPEKIDADCRTCSRFRQCGQYAVMLSLRRPQSTWVPLSSIHA